MPRSLSCLALVVLGAIQFGGTASFAQRPPSERELRIYAGLHDAAARGDVVETERLIREGIIVPGKGDGRAILAMPPLKLKVDLLKALDEDREDRF